MALKFAPSARATVGIEWELALTDKETGQLVNAGPAVIAAVKEQLPANCKATPAAELLQNTVELVSSPHLTAPAAIAEMRTIAKTLFEVCDALGLAPIGSGCHPSATWNEQLATENERYQKFMDYHGWWGRNMLIWGVHTHVGVPQKELAIPALNELLVYQPHLIALSASSPFWLGENTHYASNRTMLFQQLPSAGLPPRLQQWQDFEEAIAALKTYRIISEVDEARWDIRPAPKWGTIEMRTCDGANDLETLAVVTALTQCLAEEAYRRIEAGREAVYLPHEVRVENKWRAARFGLDAQVITNSQGDTALLADQLQQVCARLEPIAADLGCSTELQIVAARAAQRDTSAAQQIAVFEKALAAGSDTPAALGSIVTSLQQQLRESVLGK